MIVVSGTRRSGTSMWMQILKDGGFPILGSAFPAQWGRTLREGNPEGFYESHLRSGINFQTNPHPRTKIYLSPEATRRHAVKVFLRGVARSDLAFLDRIIVSMRPFREQVASAVRLEGLERAGNEQLGRAAPPPQPRLHPVFEWWTETFEGIADALVRRLPVDYVAYDNVLDDPDGTIRRVFTWLGSGDAEAACRAVRPALRREQGGSQVELPDGVTDAHVALFDRLYETIRAREALDGRFIALLNAAQDELEPHIERDRARARALVRRARSQP